MFGDNKNSSALAETMDQNTQIERTESDLQTIKVKFTRYSVPPKLKEEKVWNNLR